MSMREIDISGTQHIQTGVVNQNLVPLVNQYNQWAAHINGLLTQIDRALDSAANLLPQITSCIDEELGVAAGVEATMPDWSYELEQLKAGLQSANQDILELRKVA
jgi:hypothetical protein